MKHDFHALRIAEVRRETKDAISLGLAIPEKWTARFRFKPGQHLAVRTDFGGEEVRRTYSITSGPGDSLLWMTIKRVPGGRFSGWAHDELRQGIMLDCMAPAGRLVLPELAAGQGARRVLAIAAGSGITPIMSIVEHVLAREPDARVTLIYANRTVDDIIFRERLEGLKNRHLQRLQLLHVLSRDSEADVPLLAGRIDADKLQRLGASLCISADDDILLCGPDTLIKECRAALVQLGASKERIRFEYFKAGPQPEGGRPRTSGGAAQPHALAGAEVVSVLDGVRRTFRVAEGQRIIDAGLAAGIKLPYSCKGGMCCTCRAKLVEGQVVMDRNFSLQDWEMKAGFVLTCQSRPTTQRVVIDYDAV